jgi:hypothetical protein
LSYVQAILLVAELIVTVAISTAVILRSIKILKSRIPNWSAEKTYLMLQRWGINDEIYGSYWQKRGIRTSEEVAFIAKTANTTFATILLVNALQMSLFVFGMNRICH